jgi:hypothetical protein
MSKGLTYFSPDCITTRERVRTAVENAAGVFSRCESTHGKSVSRRGLNDVSDTRHAAGRCEYQRCEQYRA